MRDWSINYNSIKFDYEILPVIYQKRNAKTPTSDVIINTGYLKCFFSDIVVLFGYNYSTYLVVAFVRKMLGKKTVLFSESTISDKNRKKYVEGIKSIFVKNFFSSYIVPGLEAKKFIQSYGVDDNDIFLAENSVEPFSNYSYNKSPDSIINILYVGRLAKEKNIDFLIKNIPSSSNFTYRLIVVGSGPQEEELKKITVNYPIDFKGFQEGDDLANIFARSDIFVLPSSSEPWGLVINEAINMGLAPLVSDRVGCRHELVKNNGAIFKLNDAKEFQDKLLGLSCDLDTSKLESKKIASEITVNKQAYKIFEAILHG